MAVAPQYFGLTYGQGLNVGYDLYTNNTRRARTTNDILVPVGYGAVIDINGNYDCAVGAWTHATKSNVLYGGWNQPLSIIAHNEPLLMKFVISKKNGTEFVQDEIAAGAITVYLFKLSNATAYLNS